MGLIDKVLTGLRIRYRKIRRKKVDNEIFDYSKSILGHNVRISHDVYFDVINPHLIEIDDHCVLGMRSAFLTHGPLIKEKKIKIHKHVWVGFNVLVLPGCEIASDTIIGAGSVVTKSFLEGGIVIAGNPARKIRNLSNEEIKDLHYHLENVIAFGKD